MGTRLGFLFAGLCLMVAGAQGADPEKDAYKACFDKLGVKLTAKQLNGKIEDVREAYIDALKEQTDAIMGWSPDMSFSKSKALKEAFDKKERGAELFDLFAATYGKAMPYTLKRMNDNLKIYSDGLNSKEAKDPGHIAVTKALDESRAIIEDAMILNKRIEKKLQSAVEDELANAIEKNFKWDKPDSKLTRAERLDLFITGFVTQKIATLRAEERKNGEGLLPHRAVPPARGTPGTHR